MPKRWRAHPARVPLVRDVTRLNAEHFRHGRERIQTDQISAISAQSMNAFPRPPSISAFGSADWVLECDIRHTATFGMTTLQLWPSTTRRLLVLIESGPCER